MTPLEAAERLLFASRTLNDSQADVEATAKVIEKAAKNALGNSANPMDLAPLASSTIARKGSDLIGVDTGELKASIATTIGDREAWIGSPLERGFHLEYGSSREPPRPLFQLAAREGLHALEARTRQRLDRAFNGKGRVHSHGHDRWSEFWHEVDHAKHAWHSLFETLKTFVE